MSIYFSQSTLLTSFPVVMGGFKVLGRKGEEMGYGQNRRVARIFRGGGEGGGGWGAY